LLRPVSRQYIWQPIVALFSKAAQGKYLLVGNLNELIPVAYCLQVIQNNPIIHSSHHKYNNARLSLLYFLRLCAPMQRGNQLHTNNKQSNHL